MSTHQRLPTRVATAVMFVAVLAAPLAVPSPAAAGRCCYAMCRSLTGASSGVDVRCHDDGADCPRSLGACMVWAQKDVRVDCRTGRECPVGVHEKSDAEALLARLASDDDITILHPLMVELSSGVTIRFEHNP